MPSPADGDQPTSPASERHSSRPGKHTRRTPRKRSRGRTDGAHPLVPEDHADDEGMVTPTSDEWYARERPPHHM